MQCQQHIHRASFPLSVQAQAQVTKQVVLLARMPTGTEQKQETQCW